MPNRGDKLYKCWNGKLETVTFLEESIAEGAYAPTWLVRERGQMSQFGRRIRCSIGSYFTTEKAAWKAELASYKAGLKQQIKQRHELTTSIKETRQTIKELKEKLGVKPRLTNAELNSGWKSA
jgi:hypothetical protein